MTPGTAPGTAPWARPIGHGWVVRGAVPGPDVDEFAEPAEVAAALAAAERSGDGSGGNGGDTLLAVQHPQRTPDALAAGLSLPEVLPRARRALDRLRARAYRPVHRVVAPYRVDGPDGVAVGVMCLVDAAAVDRHGLARVRHSEQTYPEVVRERAAVLAGLGCATSAAMLVPVAEGERLTATVLDCVAELGEPAVSITDSGGRAHRLWLLGPGAPQEAVLAQVHRRPLLVADGNHRVAAAAAGERPDLLALVTGGPELRIAAIHRALVGTGLLTADLSAAWRRHGLVVHEIGQPRPPQHPGTVTVRARDGGLRVDLPAPRPGEPLPRIDHGLVERLLIADALGIDPEGPRVRALPAGHEPGPDVDAVLHLAPVPFADVLRVHEQGRTMPRKSTYFTPKPRSGLLLAELTGEGTRQ